MKNNSRVILYFFGYNAWAFSIYSLVSTCPLDYSLEFVITISSFWGI